MTTEASGSEWYASYWNAFLSLAVVSDSVHLRYLKCYEFCLQKYLIKNRSKGNANKFNALLTHKIEQQDVFVEINFRSRSFVVRLQDKLLNLIQEKEFVDRVIHEDTLKTNYTLG